jgi:hypothetical protein
MCAIQQRAFFFNRLHNPFSPTENVEEPEKLGEFWAG